tara:strand:- start:851 stop:1417 length:567 start_codon:yes stop_codon:yes gene_type:complete
MNLLDLVLKIDNVIPEEVCDEFVQFFEDSQYQKEVNKGGYPNWTNVRLNEASPWLDSKVHKMSLTVHHRYAEYLSEYGKYFEVGNNVRYEGTNLKRYEGHSDDVYSCHADVSSLNTAERFVAFLYYLNDDFEGGDTVFYPNTVVRPKKGSVLVFPPYWMFPHEGKPVTEGTKYIMSTYALWQAEYGQD